MSKLYTKEMFLIAAEKFDVSFINANHIIKYIDEYLTPIELPTDDEIREWAEMQSLGEPTGAEEFGRIYGAKWMKDKIQGGNNE